MLVARMKRSAIRGVPKTAAQWRVMNKRQKSPGLASGLQVAGKISAADPLHRPSATDDL